VPVNEEADAGFAPLLGPIASELTLAWGEIQGHLMAYVFLAERLAGSEAVSDLKGQSEGAAERLENAIAKACVALYDAQALSAKLV